MRYDAWDRTGTPVLPLISPGQDGTPPGVPAASGFRRPARRSRRSTRTRGWGDTPLVTATPAAESAAEPAGLARPAYLLNAGVAWFGVLLTAFLSGMGWYDDLPPEQGLYGGRPDGAAGAAGRLFDTFSYFTIWSNVVVAVSVTLLLARPLRASLARRVLRLDGLLMITVTAIVYQLLLAPSAVITGCVCMALSRWRSASSQGCKASRSAVGSSRPS